MKSVIYFPIILFLFFLFWCVKSRIRRRAKTTSNTHVRLYTSMKIKGLKKYVIAWCEGRMPRKWWMPAWSPARGLHARPASFDPIQRVWNSPWVHGGVGCVPYVVTYTRPLRPRAGRTYYCQNISQKPYGTFTVVEVFVV